MKRERKDKDFIHKPSFPGGAQGMKTFVREHLVYPEAARTAGIGGVVTLRISIDQSGAVTDTKVIAGLGHGCDEEASRVARLMRFDVPPNRGLRLLFHQTINIHFMLHPGTAIMAVPTDEKPLVQPAVVYTVTSGSGIGTKKEVTMPRQAEKPGTYTYTIPLG